MKMIRRKMTKWSMSTNTLCYKGHDIPSFPMTYWRTYKNNSRYYKDSCEFESITVYNGKGIMVYAQNNQGYETWYDEEGKMIRHKEPGGVQIF